MTTRIELANFLINNKEEKFFVNDTLIVLEEYDLDITKSVLELKRRQTK